MAKDYYAILGVERGATPDQIKKAFRKKALEHHPDRAQDKEAAEARFKEINEAYAVLSDPEKRRNYDTFGSERFQEQFSQEDIFRGFNFGSIQDILGDLGFGGDVFSRIFGRFGGGRGGFRGGPQGGPFGGGFPGFGGGFGGHPGGGFPGAQPGAGVKGRNIESELTVAFEEAVFGGERHVTVGAPGGQTRTLKIKIPPGSEDGGKLRLRGQGAPSPVGGGEAGDLLLRLRVTPHPRFARRGARDLEVEVGVSVLELVLGGSAVVPTPRGGDKRVKIKAGTQPGTAVRLKGFGVPEFGQGAAGDLYAVLRAVLPEKLTDEQRRLFEQLRDSGL